MRQMNVPLEEELTIEPMQLSDIDAVHEIEKRSFYCPWSKETFTGEIMSNSFASYWVMRKDKDIIGYGGMWLILDEAHITTLALLPEFRQRGLGSMLIEFLIEASRERGVARLTLEVRTSNQPAVTLYKKHGFVITGMRPQYYKDEDAYIMWKDDLLDEKPKEQGDHNTGN